MKLNQEGRPAISVNENKSIPQSVLDKINEEAGRLYPDHNLSGNPLIYGKRIGYKAGRLKSIEEIEKLEMIIENQKAKISYLLARLNKEYPKPL